MSKRGFTLVEVVIVLALFLVLAVAAVPIFSNFQTSTQIGQFSNQILQTLRSAREYSVARYQDSAYGIYFDTTNIGSKRFTLYQGATYASRNASFDRVFILDRSLLLTTTLTGNEINFAKGTGLPSTTGTVTVATPGGTTKVITINSYGLATQ